MSGTGEPADQGFTLIEALAALAVTALVALIAFPRMQQAFLGLAQRQTLAGLEAQLRQARADAVSGGGRMELAVVPEEHGYLTDRGRLIRTAPGIDVRSALGTPVVFYADGSSNGAALWVSAGARSLPLVVTPSGVVAPG